MTSCAKTEREPSSVRAFLNSSADSRLTSPDCPDEQDYLRLKALTVAYGNFKAVEAVDLTIGEGELFALLGPSGSGKSTLLHAIAGFVPLKSGSIELREKSLVETPPHKREIGMVFQDALLFPHRNVFENVAYGLKVRKISPGDIAEKVSQYLNLVRLGQLEKRMPNELSGGQQRRVALARALAFNPKLLLLDEPLGALDRKLRKQMQYDIRALQKELGITVIYVTHDQSEALAVSDRIGILDEGKLQQIGTGIELYVQPKNKFVASFVGGANFLPATILNKSHGQVRLSCGLNILRFDEASVAKDVDCNKDVIIMLRPEDLEMLPVENSGDSGQTGLMRAEVQECFYQGDYYVVRSMPHGVDGADGIDVKHSVWSSFMPKVGDQVVLKIVSGRGRIFNVDNKEAKSDPKM